MLAGATEYDIEGSDRSSMVSDAPVLVARYHLHYNGFNVADITDKLFMDNDGRYHLRSHAKTKGLAAIYGDIIRNSYGQALPDKGLVMEAYDQVSGRFTSEREGRIDLEGDRLLLRKGKKLRDKPLPDPLFDFLSIVYQPYVSGRVEDGSIWLTDGWRLKEYHYEVGEAEWISTGLHEDLRVIPVHLRVDDDSERTVWLAPSLGYLPARAIVNKSGRRIEVALVGLGA